MSISLRQFFFWPSSHEMTFTMADDVVDARCEVLSVNEWPLLRPWPQTGIATWCVFYGGTICVELDACLSMIYCGFDYGTRLKIYSIHLYCLWNADIAWKTFKSLELWRTLTSGNTLNQLYHTSIRQLGTEGQLSALPGGRRRHEGALRR